MRILVDADACPVKEIIVRLAKQRNIPVTMLIDTLDKLLMERHIGAKVRRGGGRTKGPAKRTKEDNERFEAAFARLLDLEES